ALAAVSDITSPSYGQHLSDDQVAALVRPSPVAIAAVETFLHGHNFSRSAHGDYVRARLAVADAETLLEATMYEFRHHESDAMVIRPMGSYAVPETVRAHVFVVDGLDHFPSNGWRTQGHPVQTFLQEPVTSVADIQQSYGIPSGLDATHARNGIVIGAFLHETYNVQDVQAYLSRNDVSSHAVPRPRHCAGNGAGAATGEASLDTQLVAALTQSDVATVLCLDSNRDPSEPFSETNQEPFLAFMQEINAMLPPPSVVSISYADDEIAIPLAYVVAIDNEFKKAGARGTTIVVSSGDSGIVGSNLLGKIGIHECDVYQPQYPASSPYVLSVGATKFGDIEEALTVPRGGAITTGAGFSGYINRTAYVDFQAGLVDDAVAALSDAQTRLFNPSGRAYPDVVAVGHNIGVFVNGGVQQTDGTSVSAPIVASIVALVNKWRLDRGGVPLGYVTPYLYELHAACPTIFRDITIGNNQCGGTDQGCCSDGFRAGSV
ncbi:hypothetical protein As57867_007202, partial [Aphanomyces stellatus]